MRKYFSYNFRDKGCSYMQSVSPEKQ